MRHTERIRLKECLKCGAQNDASNTDCAGCGRAFPWAYDIDPDTGVVALRLRDGNNEFGVTLVPAEAGRLSKTLASAIPDAQWSRCASPDSPEADDWPRASDSDDPRWRDQIDRMIAVAQGMALEGIDPNPASVKRRLGVELIQEITVSGPSNAGRHRGLEQSAGQQGSGDSRLRNIRMWADALQARLQEPLPDQLSSNSLDEPLRSIKKCIEEVAGWFDSLQLELGLPPGAKPRFWRIRESGE